MAFIEVAKASIEVYQLVGGQYQRMSTNDRGHYSISNLGVELGIWQGQYQNLDLPWLRWWDAEGNLLLIGEERAQQAEQQLEQVEQQLEQERQRNQRLLELLRSQGIEPDL